MLAKTRGLLGLCLALAIAPALSQAGEAEFYPPIEYSFDLRDREITHESSGTGGAEPRLEQVFVPGGTQTYADWWIMGDQSDLARKRMQTVVDTWKQAAHQAWASEDDPGEIEFRERLVGRLLSVYSEGHNSIGDPPCAVFDLVTGRQLKLSDLFYDGFNYIDYINTFLAQQPDQCYHCNISDNGPIESMFKRPFSGLARDYPYFGVHYPGEIDGIDDPLPVMLKLLWTRENPFWQAPMLGYGSQTFDYTYVGVPLAHWASPYGECLLEVQKKPVPWQGLTLYAPQVSIDQGRYPEAEAKINQALRAMTDTFLNMEIEDAVDPSGWGYGQLEPYLARRGQTLYVSFGVPTEHSYVTVFEGSFDLHTGERFDSVWQRMGGAEELRELCLTAAMSRLGISGSEAELRITYEGMEDTFRRMRWGEADLAFSTYDADAMLACWTGEAGQTERQLNETTQHEYIPIARDALIFVDRQANPVEGLSSAELQGIFEKSITRWGEVGGNGEAITAHEPDTETVAYAALRELLLQEAASAHIVVEGDDFDGIYSDNWNLYYVGYHEQEGIAALMNSRRDIIRAEDALRVMAVDGIAPTEEMIAEGRYPFCITYYAVLPKDLPADHPAREMVAWLLSEEGQVAMRYGGYAPITTGAPESQKVQ